MMNITDSSSGLSTEEISWFASRPGVRRRLIDSLMMLDNDDVDLGRLTRFGESVEIAGTCDGLLDNATLAHAAATLLQPARALEIGVRRGFTTCAIVAACPTVEMHMLDSWRPIYSDRPNPGPDLLRKQLSLIGHAGSAHFHQGNSHELLPQLAKNNLTFDLIVVDGDHTERGASEDLRDAFALLAPGGVLIFDDLVHPQHGYLRGVWRHWSSNLANTHRFAEYCDNGLGVGWAIRAA